MEEKILSNYRILKEVNAIIHPAVKEYILNSIQTEREKQEIDVFFLEAALLIEAGYLSYLDELWYIYSEKNARIKRLKESRAYSDEKIQQIMDSQLSDEEFKKHADVVLDNSNDFEHTLAQIKTECIRLNLWKS